MKKIKAIKKRLRNLIDEYTMPIIDFWIQRTRDLNNDITNLEWEYKKIERKMERIEYALKRVYRILILFCIAYVLIMICIVFLQLQA